MNQRAEVAKVNLGAKKVGHWRDNGIGSARHTRGSQLLLNNPLVSHFLCGLDTVVTTVDAANAVHQLDHQYGAVKQVALADRLLITKCDLVSLPPAGAALLD